MNYVPHTASERAAMLRTIGLESERDLFADVPGKYRFPELDLPAPLSEMEIERDLRALAEHNDRLTPVPASWERAHITTIGRHWSIRFSGGASSIRPTPPTSRK